MVSRSVTRMPWMNSLFLPIFFQQRADLRAAAVHHHRVHADQFHQHDVAREALLEGLVHHGVAAILDDHGLAAEALDIRQRLDQETRAFAGRLGVDAHGFFSRSCIRSRWTQSKKLAHLHLKVSTPRENNCEAVISHLHNVILTILPGAELDGRRPPEGCAPGMVCIKILKNPVNPVNSVFINPTKRPLTRPFQSNGAACLS